MPHTLDQELAANCEEARLRFENIIRARLKGTRVKNVYGGTYLRDKRNNIIRDANGNAIITGQIQVPDALPTLRPVKTEQ